MPELVKVNVCGVELPTATLLKLKLPGVALSELPLAMALPVRLNICGEPGALSVNTMLPVEPDVDVGENVTLNWMFDPAVILVGSDSPDIPKPVPEIVAKFSVSGIFPLFVSVTGCVLVCPTTTLLKLKDAGEIESAGCMPVPLREIDSGEFEASLVTVNVPFAAPGPVGANCTCTVALCPTGTEADGLPPTTVKPVPVMPADAIFTVAVPVFVTVRLWVLVVPTFTFPNETVAELGDRMPDWGSPVVPPPGPLPTLVALV